MRCTRWLRIVVVAVTLLAAPGISLAQDFPSPRGGGQDQAGQGQGGVPSEQGAGQQPARGSFYRSTVYGFSLSFGPPWTVAERFGGPGQGFEGISVFNGMSGVVFSGADTSDTPQVVVQKAAEGVAQTSGVAMNFHQVVIDEAEVAAAYYLSADNQLGARIHAIKQDPATAFMVVWLFPPAQHETETEAYNLLVEGLQR